MSERPEPLIRLSGGRQIGPGRPCFLVAEIGGNHQGDVRHAERLIEEAAAAGADAVKFQKRDMRAMLTAEGLAAPYVGPNSFGPTYGEHREALEFDFQTLAGLKRRAESLGLVFFASVWDLPSLEGMLDVGMELVKIASADLTTVPLLRRVAASGLPVILSTGMSDQAEIDRAVAELGGDPSRLALLHCNSAYPCPEADIRLRDMRALADRYGLATGYSGHEKGLGPSVAAVALGACVVERHFTLDKTQRGGDHRCSLTPPELALLATMIREVEVAMGEPKAQSERRATPAEAASARKLRKSLVAARDLPAGRILSPEDLAVKSPGDGLSPLTWDEVLGRRLTRPIRKDEQFAWDTLDTPKGRQEKEEEEDASGGQRGAAPLETRI